MFKGLVNTMNFKKLGNTDLKVSTICLSTMTWGAQNTQKDAFEQMDYAIDHGINFFDTAELYAVPMKPETRGKTSQFIGEWFLKTKKRLLGEIVLIISGYKKDKIHDIELKNLILKNLNKKTTKDLSSYLSDKTGLGKNFIYNEILKLKSKYLWSISIIILSGTESNTSFNSFLGTETPETVFGDEMYIIFVFSLISLINFSNSGRAVNGLLFLPLVIGSFLTIGTILLSTIFSLANRVKELHPGDSINIFEFLGMNSSNIFFNASLITFNSFITP